MELAKLTSRCVVSGQWGGIGGGSGGGNEGGNGGGGRQVHRKLRAQLSEKPVITSASWSEDN